MEVNVDEIIKSCQSGQLKDIAKSGHVPCYEINDDFVLVVRSSNMAENSKKLMELSLKGIKDVCSVVDYRVIEENCYEIQKRARGEHFRTDETKQQTIDNISQKKRLLSKAQERLNKNSNDFNKRIVTLCLEDIKAYEIYMDGAKYKSLKYDTRKDELMARYSMIMKMPTQHIKDFFETIMQLSDNKMSYDPQGNNLLYDEENGFSVIDLSEEINGEENFSNILNASNYYTMEQLLGTNKIKEVPSEEHETAIEAMRESLKKIVISIIDLEHDGKRISLEQIQESLSTYKQYGIALSVDEILEDKNKNEEYIITLGEIGKGTVNTPIKTKNAAEQRVTIDEKSIEKQEEQHKE